MRSTCPSCRAGYDIPDALVGAGRTVRCAHCGHAWTVEPSPQPPPPRPPAPVRAPPPTMASFRSEPPPAVRGSRGALIGWAATIAVLALGAAAAVHWREQVMQTWPASARAYAAVGLASVNDGSGASR